MQYSHHFANNPLLGASESAALFYEGLEKSGISASKIAIIKDGLDSNIRIFIKYGVFL